MSIARVVNDSLLNYQHHLTKTMKSIPALPVLLLLLATILTSCESFTKSPPSPIKLGVSRIDVRDVPKAVLAAAEHHVPGIYIHEAGINHHRTHDVYELRGLSHHVHYDVYVTADGHVLDIDHDKWLSD